MLYYIRLGGAFTPPRDPQFRRNGQVGAQDFEQTRGDRCYHAGVSGARDPEGEKMLLLQ